MKNTTLLTASVFGYNVQDNVIFFRSTYRSGKDKNQQFTMAVARPSNNVDKQSVPVRIKQAEALISELDGRSDSNSPVRVVLEGSLADVTASQGKGDNANKIYGDLTIFASEITPAFFGSNVTEVPASS